MQEIKIISAYRQSLKTRILEAASDAFSQKGIKSVRMDDIAQSLNISKRTLYELFPDKHTLISEAVHMMHDRHKRAYEEIFRSSANNFEALLNVYKQVRHHIENTSVVFLDDIKRLYPDIFEQYRHNEKEAVKSFAGVVSKAQQEGMVLPRINSEVAATIFFITMHNLKQSEAFFPSQHSRLEIFDGAFLNFVRGIATIKGIGFIDEFLSQNFTYNHNTTAQS